MVELGQKVRDTQTGFTGLAVGRAEYLDDVPDIAIQGPCLKDGKFPDSHWIPEQRVVLASKKRAAKKKSSPKTRRW